MSKIPALALRRWRAALSLFALAFLAALALLMSPGVASAGNIVYAHSKDGQTNYYSFYDAWNAAMDGVTVVMDYDWETSEVLTMPSNKTATIEMNGHRIARVDLLSAQERGQVIWMGNDSTLTLTGSSTPTTFQFKGSDPSAGRDVWCSVAAGGLITGGNSLGLDGWHGAGIWVGKRSTLNLNNVAVSGNTVYKGHGGGLALADNATLNMQDSYVTNNCAWGWLSYGLDGNKDESYTPPCGGGGGIYVQGSGCTVNMTASHVDENSALVGAGVYVRGAGSVVSMKDSSTVDHNKVNPDATDLKEWQGAGYYFHESFTLVGDGTASVSHNVSSVSAGGVGMFSAKSLSTPSKISGINLTGNEGVTGGAIHAAQSDLVIENCTISGNKASDNGGGVFVDNTSGITLRGCTVTENTTGGEGGGVFVWFMRDLNVGGKLIVRDNQRTDGAADDVFLDSSSNNLIWSYLNGNVSEGSCVGVRTGVTGDRRIAIGLTNYIEGSFFLDQGDAYHLEYVGSDGKLYQKKGSSTYQLTVNGEEVGRYSQGEQVTVDVADWEDDRIFDHWSVEESTGLWDVASRTDLGDRYLALTMPGNDVHLVAVYGAKKIESVDVKVPAPVAYEAFPTSATLEYADESGAVKTAEVSVAWQVQQSNGDWAAASEKLPPLAATYRAIVTAPEDRTMGRVYSLSLGTDGTTLVLGEGLGGNRVESASVDKETGALTVVSAPIAFHVLTFDSRGGVNITNQVVADGELAVTPDAPHYAHHVFRGWYTSASYARAWRFASDVVTQDLTLYAKWDMVKVSVSFDSDRGSYTPGMQWVAWGGTASEPAAPTREGFTFAGWYAPGSSNAFDFSTAIRETLTLTAHWEPAVLQVAFDAAGGTPAPEAQAVQWGGTASEPAAPTREGFTFAGWYAPGSSNAFDFSTKIYEALTLTARWEPVVLQVTFDAAGGTPAPEAQAVQWGAAASEPAAPAREGFAFEGWYAPGSEEAWDFSAAIHEALTLTAHWSPLPPTEFSDVDEDAWYYPYVSRAASLGLINGYTDSDGYTGLFGPEDALTRGQVATILWRMAGKPAATGGKTFPDVDASMYCAEAVSWCADRGIDTGYTGGDYAGQFRPDAPVTREELATMVCRYESYHEGIDTSNPSEEALQRCVDSSDVSGWARSSMAWCAQAGVLTGKNTAEGTLRLDARQGATRAQAAAVFTRALDVARGVAPQADVTAQQDQAEAGQAQADEEASFDDVAFGQAVVADGPADAGGTQADQVAEDAGASDGAATFDAASDTDAVAESGGTAEDAAAEPDIQVALDDLAQVDAATGATPIVEAA